jgi:hypothetical protein
MPHQLRQIRRKRRGNPWALAVSHLSFMGSDTAAFLACPLQKQNGLYSAVTMEDAQWTVNLKPL